jgi:hypothetical protein
VCDAKLALRPVADARIQQALQNLREPAKYEDDIMEVRLRDEHAEREQLEAQHKALAEQCKKLRVR